MATLFSLTQEQAYLLNLLESGDAIDLETGEIDPVVAEQLQLTGEELDEKIKGTAIVYKQLVANAKMYKDEEDNIIALRKRAERNAELLKNRLQEAMLIVGKTELKDPKATITFRKSTRVEILDESKLSKDYITEKTTYTPSKTAIMDALKNGINVEGAKLIEVQNIQIK